MSRGRLFASLTGMVFLVNMARVVYAPLLEPLRVAFDASHGTVGFVATLVWVGSALPRIPTGYLLTVVPRHRVVLGAGAVLAGSSLVATGAWSVATLGVGALLMGLASGAYFVAANPLVSELYPHRVGRMMGIHGTASQFAAVIAAPGVGLALAVATWHAVFGVIGAGALVATAVFYRESRRTELPDAAGADRDLPTAVRSQWPLIVTGVVVLGTAGFVWQGLFNFYVSYLSAEKALTQSTARDLLTVAFVAGVPAFFVSGRLTDRLPQVPYVLSLVAAFVVCVFGVTLAEGLLALVVATAAVGYAIHSLFPAVDTYLLSTLPDEHRGGAYAVFSGTMMLAQATGSSVVGALVDRGVAYGAIFQWQAALLAAVVAGLGALAVAGRLPGGRRAGVEADRARS